MPPSRKKATRKKLGSAILLGAEGPLEYHEYEKECANTLKEAEDYYADNLKLGEIKHFIDFSPSTPFPERHARMLDIFDNLGLETARLRTLFKAWILEEAASSKNAQSWAEKQGWLKKSKKSAEIKPVLQKKPATRKKMTRRRCMTIKKD